MMASSGIEFGKKWEIESCIRTKINLFEKKFVNLHAWEIEIAIDNDEISLVKDHHDDIFLLK
jgi:hypothetical protein